MTAPRSSTPIMRVLMMSADLIDNACELEERQRQQAIDAHQANNAHRPLLIDGVRVCLDCEEDIHERLAALPTAVRCLLCQEQYEKQNINKPRMKF